MKKGPGWARIPFRAQAPPHSQGAKSQAIMENPLTSHSPCPHTKTQRENLAASSENKTEKRETLID